VTINLRYCKRPDEAYVQPAQWKDRRIWLTYERATDVVIPGGRTRNALITRLHEYAHVAQFESKRILDADYFEKHRLFIEAEASAIALQWTRTTAADVARCVDCLVSHAAYAPPLPSCYGTEAESCARYLARHAKRIARRFNACAPIIQGRLL
jgi:hypothetical protein